MALCGRGKKNEAPIEHRVSRGESLSILAQRYGVSVRELKSTKTILILI